MQNKTTILAQQMLQNNENYGLILFLLSIALSIYSKYLCGRGWIKMFVCFFIFIFPSLSSDD